MSSIAYSVGITTATTVFALLAAEADATVNRCNKSNLLASSNLELFQVKESDCTKHFVFLDGPSCPGNSPCKTNRYLMCGDVVLRTPPSKPPSSTPEFSCFIFRNDKGKETVGLLPTSTPGDLLTDSTYGRALRDPLERKPNRLYRGIWRTPSHEIRVLETGDRQWATVDLIALNQKSPPLSISGPFKDCEDSEAHCLGSGEVSMTLAGRYKLTDGPVTATLLRLQDKLVAVVTGKNGRVIAEDVFERAGDLDVPYKFADRLYQDKIAALIRQDTTTRKWKAIAISNEVYARSDKETGKQNGAKKGISTDHYAFFWNDREIPSIEFFFETARKGSWGRTFDYKGKAVTIDYQRIRYGEQTLFDRLPDLLKTQADDVDCGDDPDRASKSKWEPQSGLWTEFKPLSLVGPMLTYSFNPNQRPSCLGDLGAFENCEVVVLDLDTGSPPKMDKFFEESSFKAAVTQNPPTRFATDRSYDGFIEPEAIAIKGFDSASGRAELLVRWTDRKRGMSDFDTAVTTAYVTPTDFFRPFLERAAASGFLVGDADKW